MTTCSEGTNENLSKIKVSDDENIMDKDCLIIHDILHTNKEDDDAEDEKPNPKNELNPPPGSPKPVNTARLRRYRLN